ncbi:MAG: PQQ-dependent dehydrogenase, methanol/ethanol family, partial [Parasphingorhabdus sp.]
MRRLGMLLAPLMLVACQSQTSEPDAADAAAATDWSNIGFDAKEQRHSPLDKINESNVGELGIAWFKDLPDARGQEATPIVVD